MSSVLIIPESAHLSVQRGRDYARRLNETVANYQQQGRTVVEVRISADVANDMRAFFQHAFAEFDGVLPRRIMGVPLHEGGTGGRDYQISLRNHNITGGWQPRLYNTGSEH